jgi:beta-glucosidase
MGRASVLALQGGPGNASTYLPDGRVCSLGKHFAAYGASIGGLNGGPADVSNRTLHEVYLRPWMALSRAGVRAVMPSV